MSWSGGGSLAYDQESVRSVADQSVMVGPGVMVGHWLLIWDEIC